MINRAVAAEPFIDGDEWTPILAGQPGDATFDLGPNLGDVPPGTTGRCPRLHHIL